MILNIVLASIISLLTFICLVLVAKVVVMRNDMAELNLRVALTEQKIKSQSAEPIEQSEGFLRFISESRDWAFQYIEEFQAGLNNFVSAIEPEINYFKEYGDISSMSPNYYSLKKIVGEFEKLKELLPKEE
jgi:hypothetical protein